MANVILLMNSYMRACCQLSSSFSSIFEGEMSMICTTAYSVISAPLLHILCFHVNLIVRLYVYVLYTIFSTGIV